MEYVVLARKLRPQRFDELIGQETIAQILRNAIRTDRVAHAFLFAGSRGVGKTSAARILTKALNCEQPQAGEPCNACPTCREITAGSSPDVYEIDAASNRGIDNIRELRENANYQPAKSRYKTYIIDEAHMLTTESFNALLKTLEEPPERVKFILATTAPHRIPDTIHSRCQRFDFSRIPVAVMAAQLGRIAETEGLTLSPSALEAIARNAAGGMRDALTALDQVISFVGQAPTDEEVLRLLGLIDSREVLELLEAVLARDLGQALKVLSDVLERGHDVDTLLAGILRELKDLSLFAALSAQARYFQDHPPDALEFYRRHAADTPVDLLQQLFHLFMDLEGQLNRTTQTRACFEMALAKACRAESLVGVPDLLARLRGLLGDGKGGKTPTGAGPSGAPAGGSATRPAPAPTAAPPGSVRAQAAPPTPPPEPAAPRESRPTAAASEPTAEDAGPTAGGAESTTSPAAAPSEPGKMAAPQPAPAAPAPPGTNPPAPAAPPAAADTSPAAPGDDHPAAHPAAPAPVTAGNGSGAMRATPGPMHSAPPSATPPNGSGQPAAVDGPGDPWPSQAPDDPAALPPLPAEAPCDDPRFADLLERLKAGNKSRLWALLRRAEVAEWGPRHVSLLLPGPGDNLGPDDQQWLSQALQEALGQGFECRVIDDTNRRARPAYTLSGREQLARLHQESRERQAARGDAAIGEVLHFFPRGAVRDIRLDPAALQTTAMPDTAPQATPSQDTEDV